MKKLLLSLFFVPLVAQGQIIKTVAGSGTVGGYSGDGAAATSALLKSPAGTVLDASGNLYICEFDNSIVRKVSPTGIITTFVGNGMPGYSGDGGPASAARLKNPVGIAKDAAGNIYICDYGNHCIRKVNAATNIITTIAGTSASGYNGDGIAATSAQLSFPLCVTVAPSGDVYFTDGNNQRVRKINTNDTISTVAGIGTSGFAGDGGPATAARVANPFGIALDEAGNIYFSDQSNNRIRKINSAGVISTIAGTGTVGYSGDGGAATLAQLNTPIEVSLDTGGHLLVADRHNNCVRRIKLSTGIITTVAGTGAAGFSGDGGPATAAQLNEVGGVMADGTGVIYVSDFDNHRVRKVWTPAPTKLVMVTETFGDFLMHPNPATDALILSSDSRQIEELRIMNLLGQNVLTLQQLNRKEIAVDISDLPAGVYILEVNRTETKRFVKK